MQANNITIPGAIGNIEARWRLASDNKGALICHPHPLYKGNMDNKVVTSCVNACESVNLSSLCFNYRGVGASEGDYSDLNGAYLDAKAAYNWFRCKNIEPSWIIGFSFGSYIALRLASEFSKQVILLAPPVERMPFTVEKNIKSITIIQGDIDKIAKAKASQDWANKNDLKCVVMQDTGHFFHGKLLDLMKHISQVIVGAEACS